RSTAESGECRPFAVFSGVDMSPISPVCGAADHLYEQNWPVSLWGNEYEVMPFTFKIADSVIEHGGCFPYSFPWFSDDLPRYAYRILPGSDGTSVIIDGGDPFTLNAGSVKEYYSQTEPHCINASGPVCVIQFMMGLCCGGNGDPEMLILDDVT